MNQGLIIVSIIAGIVIWVLLFFLVYWIGNRILDSSRRYAIKKWEIEERDYDYEKWQFRFYVITFFIGIPVLFFIAVFQEIF